MKYIPPYGATDPDAAWINGNPGAGIKGSILSAEAVEHPLRELVAAIAGAGLVPAAGDLTQLARAIQSRGLIRATPGGTAAALTGALTLPVTALYDGLTVLVTPTVALAEGATFRLDATAALPVRRIDGAAIAAADVPAGVSVEMTYSAALASWVVGNAVAWGRLARVVVLTYSQTYTAPAAVRSAIVTCVGGGGAGGGVPATSAGQSAAGAGGSGGQIATGWLTAGFGGGVAVTVGAGGAANSGTNGGNGSATSFGALVMARGGVGGEYLLTSSYATTAAGLADSGAYTAPLWGAPGTVGAPGIVLNPGTSQIGGNGAAGYRGFGSGAGSKNGGGGNGGGNGSGGGGAASGASTAARAGGAGGAGLVIIEEYA